MNVRAICEGAFTLPLPLVEAMPLFTPEGERRWAGPSWDPAYPLAEPEGDGASAGTVFTTQSDGGFATWIVVDRGDDHVTYARVVPDRIAGTVSVRCSPSTATETRVTVRYDVTSLGAAGVVFVNELEAGYDAFLAEWRREILAAVVAGRDIK